MQLIDQLMQILEANPDLELYERAVLKTAISFLEQKEPSRKCLDRLRGCEWLKRRIAMMKPSSPKLPKCRNYAAV